ncbi:hypothetical protein LCGC14_1387090 [marine sediment metagenome]|uniref:Metallo-beta-lactamase domain-containing protein n=1 Tax=marine sediment metagenome TaxID=412755 RepID=A0A0F9N2J0_9ZZZZ
MTMDGLPTISFEIDLRGRSLGVVPWPTAHTGTDLSVAVGDILFAGDLVFADHAPALDGSVTGWQSVLTDLTALPVGRVVPGHGCCVLDWPEGARDLSRYLGVLADDTRQAIGRGLSLGDAMPLIAQGEAPLWALFDAYNPRNATVAYTELEWE